jgi:hypothetical protein
MALNGRGNFKVRTSIGEYIVLIIPFTTLKRARNFVLKHSCQASFSIILPNGQVYDWSDNVPSQKRKPKHRS